MGLVLNIGGAPDRATPEELRRRQRAAERTRSQERRRRKLQDSKQKKRKAARPDTSQAKDDSATTSIDVNAFARDSSTKDDCHGAESARRHALGHLAAAAATQEAVELVRREQDETLSSSQKRKRSTAVKQRTPMDNARVTGARRAPGIGSLLDSDSDSDSSGDEGDLSGDVRMRSAAAKPASSGSKTALDNQPPARKRQKIETEPPTAEPLAAKRKDTVDFTKLAMFRNFDFHELPTTDFDLESQQKRLFGEGQEFECFEAMPGISDRLANSLKQRLSIERPTFVQRRAIPPQFAGHDCLIRAETGSGKTISYVVPLIERLHTSSRSKKIERGDGTLGLIISPTRELCMQIYEVLVEIGKDFKFLVPGYLIGGEKKKSEKARLRKGITLLVATPGRLLDHLQTTQAFVCSNLSTLILDEADRLLDMGFEQDLQLIVDLLRQRASSAGKSADHPFHTTLCSATLPPGIQRLAGMSLRKPVAIDIVAQQRQERELAQDAARTEVGESITPETLTQYYTVVPTRHRLETLAAFLRGQLSSDSVVKMIVFVASKDEVEFLHAVLGSTTIRTKKSLAGEGAPTEVDEALIPDCKLYRLHGTLSQVERTKVFRSFMEYSKGGEEDREKSKSSILFATDVAARGLDFPGVDWIVQYDPPLEPPEYVHRVGRAARLGTRGRALLFLQPHELGFLGHLSETTGLPKQCLELLQVGKIFDSLTLLPERGYDDDVAQAEKLLADARAEQQKIRAHLAKLKAEKGVVEGQESFQADEEGTIADRLVGELPVTTTVLQWQIMRLVNDSPELHKMASKAFASTIRAYATYPRELKEIFSVRRLHLGHLARSFALRDKPSDIVSVSASGQVRTRFVKDGEGGGETEGARSQPKKQRRRGALNELRSAGSISRHSGRNAHRHTGQSAMASEFASGF